MCLDFALEMNSRYSSCLLIRVKAGLWEDGERVKDRWRSFYLRFPCLGRTAVDMTVAWAVASFLSLPAYFVSFPCACLPHFHACSRAFSFLLKLCSTADTSHEDMRLTLLPSVVFVSLFSSLQLWDVWVKSFLAEQLTGSHWQCGSLVLDKLLPLKAVGSSLY